MTLWNLRVKIITIDKIIITKRHVIPTLEAIVRNKINHQSAIDSKWESYKGEKYQSHSIILINY